MIKPFALAALGAAFLLVACALDTAPMERAVVHVRSPMGTGTGLLIAPATVLTTAHFLPPGFPVVVTLESGKIANAAILWRDDERDLALLALDERSAAAPAVFDCRPMAAGEAVTVIGHPLNSQWLVTRGAVGSRHPHRAAPVDRIVLSVRVGPGSSGSPVFDAAGRVRGIVQGASGARVVVPLFALAMPSNELCAIPEIRRRATRVTDLTIGDGA